MLVVTFETATHAFGGMRASGLSLAMSFPLPGKSKGQERLTGDCLLTLSATDLRKAEPFDAIPAQPKHIRFPIFGLATSVDCEEPCKILTLVPSRRKTTLSLSPSHRDDLTRAQRE